MREKEYLLKYKTLYTIMVLIIYLIGNNIPLFMIDISAYLHKNIDNESMIMQMITGDVRQSSLFLLGISPIMIASIFVQIITVIMKSQSKSKTSPSKIQRWTLMLTLIIAILQAIIQVQSLMFKVEEDLLLFAKGVAVIEMVTGVMIILWLTSNNKRFGIAGQTVLIFVNILDGLMKTIQGHSFRQLLVPMIISVIGIIIMLIMENSEMRIPLQRISIHNIYSDKNYMAIKLNPVGVMPAMFAAAFFMLPQMLIEFLLWGFPENNTFLWWQAHMSLTKPLGMGVYILFIYLLTIGFSRLFVSPKEITEQFLKGGDSLVDIHAGKETKKYLSKVINTISFFSATVMSMCLITPILLQHLGGIESSLVTLPTSIMMLTGIWCNIYREAVAIRDLEAYEPFI